MRLLQAIDEQGRNAVVVAHGPGTEGRLLPGTTTVHGLATQAVAEGVTIADVVNRSAQGDTVDLAAWLQARRLRVPIEHPDPAHLLVSGTGLTHLGSAEGRDRMHRKAAGSEPVSDSMKMFRMGLEGGKPPTGEMGVQPEWFYKGDGQIIAPPEGDLALPEFALDGGEEPEIAGVYLIGPDGTPCRVGFVLGNEFSDHVTERENYLFLAHSKLRACALGPELLLGDLPRDVHGVSRIRRDGEVLWEKPFLTGEDNMSHSLANLEAHHFKYRPFRRPGDIHVHFFGTATLSFSDGVSPRAGDTFELEADPFALPLRNTMVAESGGAPPVRVL
ncbi:MAG TPA: AraD1 family protein [Gammaproteobacteria bacterium]|nr:AraD1 family protein [Gammaproteobacteria bacterium]